jgi:hypothetical protein
MGKHMRTHGWSQKLFVLIATILGLLITGSIVFVEAKGDKGSKGDKTYPLYVNGDQIADDSITVEGIDIDINPGPAKDGNFYNDAVTLES